MKNKQGIIPVIFVCAMIAGFGVIWTAIAGSMLRETQMRVIGIAFIAFGVLFTIGMIALVISSAVRTVKKFDKFRTILRSNIHSASILGNNMPFENEIHRESELVFCPYCGAATDASTGVCTHCSAPLSGGTEKNGFCPFCGAPSPKGYSFCRKCGKRLPLS